MIDYKEAHKLQETKTAVYYDGREYIITGIIKRHGKLPYQTNHVPRGWWFELELMNTDSNANSVSIVNPAKVSKERIIH